MDHNGEVWAAVAVALINMIGSVAMAWIRGRYDVRSNGEPQTIPKQSKNPM